MGFRYLVLFLTEQSSNIITFSVILKIGSLGYSHLSNCTLCRTSYQQTNTTGKITDKSQHLPVFLLVCLIRLLKKKKKYMWHSQLICTQPQSYINSIGCNWIATKVLQNLPSCSNIQLYFLFLCCAFVHFHFFWFSQAVSQLVRYNSPVLHL